MAAHRQLWLTVLLVTCVCARACAPPPAPRAAVQVGDIYPRDQLGKALSWFSLSRMFAALGGPVVGGFICQFFGWRSTFLLCAILDTILATVCYFHVPETLLTPKESRPQLAWSIPIRPLAEIVKDRSVGLVCFLGALNHGLVYMVALLVPKIGALLTFNESVIGLFMVPVTCGTVMGSLLGGKFLSRSGGKYKEWKGMRLGMCLAATAAILFGSVILSICGDDMTFARVLNSTAWELGGSGSLSGEDDDAAAAAAWAAAGNSTPTAETVPRSVVDWRGYSRDEMNAVDATDSYIVLDSRKWDPFDPVLGMRQTNFRIEHGQLCTAEKWRWQWILPTVLVQFAIGFGGSLAMVAATTYLALSRPDTRASVAASQRCTQQVGAAGSVLLCGFLFDNRSFGPPRAGAALGIGVLVALALLLGCVKREPAPKSNSALAQPRSSSGTPVKLVQRGGAYSPGKL
jgi:predicted MFS family arabinose efflux permease